MKDSLRVGIIGAGVGLKGHAKSINEIPSVNGVPISVGAISSLYLTEEQKRILYIDFPETTVFVGQESATRLIDSPEVDVVIIASPDPIHVYHAEQVLASGKPGLIEKPFVLDRIEGNRLIDYAGSRGLSLSLSTQMRYHERPRQILEEMVKRKRDSLDPISVEISYLLRTPSNGREVNHPGIDVLPHIISLFPLMHITGFNKAPENMDLLEFKLETGCGLVNGSMLMGYVPASQKSSRTIRLCSGFGIAETLTHEGSNTINGDGVYYERWTKQGDGEKEGWVKDPRGELLKEWFAEVLSNDPIRIGATHERVYREHNTFMDAMEVWKKG